jgi:hypothetical protein
MDFAKKLLPFSSHNPFIMFVPYLLLVLASIGLQYLQMSRLNARNPAASANPQAAMLQKYMPIVFGLIYLNIPAAVNVYFIVSSAIRIGTQEVLFRRGIVGGPPVKVEEKETPARSLKPGSTRPKPGSARPRSGSGTGDRPTRPRTGPAKTGSGSGSGQRPSSGSGGTGSRPRPKTGGSPSTKNGAGRPSGARPAGTKGTAGGAKDSTGRPAGARPSSGRSGSGSGTGSKSPNGTGRSRPGSPRGTGKSSGNGTASNGDGSNGDGSGAPKAHPRSKSKRDRKAR